MSAAGSAIASTDGVMVLIPALNEAGSLPGVLAALRAQGFAHVRVVDNGSSDGTGEAARLAGAEVIPEPRRGYGRACWRGLQELPESVSWIMWQDDLPGSQKKKVDLPAMAGRLSQSQLEALSHFLEVRFRIPAPLN